MIVEVSKAVALLSNGSIIKLLKSRECPPNHRRQQQNINQQASWPIIFDIDDAPSLSFARNKVLNNRMSSERLEEKSITSTCYLVIILFYYF